MCMLTNVDEIGADTVVNEERCRWKIRPLDLFHITGYLLHCKQHNGVEALRTGLIQ